MDHVEECPSYYVDCLGTICDCDYEHICMCRELRACEKRVEKIAYQQGLGAGSDEHGQHEIGWMKGYDAALDDARESVVNRRILDPYDPSDPHDVAYDEAMKDSLAAIDALRKEDQ